MFAQGGEDFLDGRGDVAETESFGVLLAEGDRLEDLLLRLRAESGELSHFAGFAEFLELRHGIDPEVFVERLDLFGPEALDLEQFEKARGNPAFSFS